MSMHVTSALTSAPATLPSAHSHSHSLSCTSCQLISHVCTPSCTSFTSLNQGRTGHRGYRGNPRWADEVGMVRNTGPPPSPAGAPSNIADTSNYFPFYSEHVQFPMLTLTKKKLTDIYSPPRDLYSH